MLPMIQKSSLMMKMLKSKVKAPAAAGACFFVFLKFIPLFHQAFP